MQLAEMRERHLRPEPDRARAAGMEPRRRIPRDHQPRRIEAERRDEGRRIRLRIEQSYVHLRRAPLPSASAQMRESDAHTGGGEELILRLDAAIGLADLEQAEIRLAAIEIALGGREQTGQQ